MSNTGRKIAIATTVASPTGRIPRQQYTVRFISAKLGKSSKGLEQIETKAEIIQPDVVPDPANPEISLQVAGRKLDVYMTVDPMSKAFGGWCTALTTLGLVENGELDLDAAVDKLASGTVFAKIIVDSEEQIQRQSPAPGQPAYMAPPIIGADGQPLKAGWKPKYISSNDIMEKAEDPGGLPAVGKGPY